jgi:hypothetical protein
LPVAPLAARLEKTNGAPMHHWFLTRPLSIMGQTVCPIDCPIENDLMGRTLTGSFSGIKV